MKHFLVLLLAISLFTSCNNKKEKDRGYDRRERDDYRAKEGKDDETDGNEKSTKTDFSDNEGWSEADIEKMNRECLKSIKGNEELGSQFCPCVLEKMQKKYSSYADLDARGTEAEGKRIGEECAAVIRGNSGNDDGNTNSGGGSWSTAEVNAFVGPCVSSAVNGGMQRTTARNYCECMQQKLEKIYPNASDAGSLTSEDMESPAMKRMVQSCLDEN